MPSSETQPSPIIIESPVVTGVSPVPPVEEAIDATSIRDAPVSAASVPAIEDPQPQAAIESAIPAEPIVEEQPEAEEPPPVMVEPIPPEVIVPSPAPVIEEVPVTVLEPAVALEPETQQNPPSTEDQTEVESNPITP